ncbi:DUF4190 domain-containing protein [Nocardioides sp. cx-173]|uniref:DUF4190 domain-containing protein n=1 Tax=Nocardioides sp. cx-173 TaxID=2898796 RepID=UPI001E320729|nr:DUF4190 domain-containing protein [Nocardioides sp. cx-173]MCD4524455.1 DUF4190 domain-containing protein [Nocardioides sp. cx-173]UGB43059.1 DUF4190 domain-containing protein [Nocardioides sp. cx-173]
MSEQPPPASPSVPALRPPPPSNGHAIASLVLGVTSLMGCSFVTGIPAMVLSRIARREIAASQGETAGEDLARIGFALGAVATVIGVLALVGLLILGGLGLFVFDVCGDGQC